MSRSLYRRRTKPSVALPRVSRSHADPLSFLTDPPVATAILLHLELPHSPPLISPARGPPQGDLLLDQTPAFDPTEAEPVPDFVFDPSLPNDFDD